MNHMDHALRTVGKCQPIQGIKGLDIDIFVLWEDEDYLSISSLLRLPPCSELAVPGAFRERRMRMADHELSVSRSHTVFSDMGYVPLVPGKDHQ